MKILFVGPQGSGKSTQSKLLSAFLGIPAISTGDIFREIASRNDPEGKRIRAILNSGQLVDDVTVSKLVEKQLSLPKYSNGFILDGYPRSINQIQFFDPKFQKVIYLKLSDEQAKERLVLRNREDDLPTLIEQRLEIYHNLTDPIIEYYKNLRLLEVIDANLSIDKAQRQIREKING